MVNCGPELLEVERTWLAGVDISPARRIASSVRLCTCPGSVIASALPNPESE
jgi:hypothetical protein